MKKYDDIGVGYPSMALIASLISRIEKEETDVWGASFCKKETEDESIGVLLSEEARKIFLLIIKQRKNKKELKKDIEISSNEIDKKDLLEKIIHTDHIISICITLLETYIKRIMRIDLYSVVFKKDWELCLILEEENRVIKETDEMHKFIDLLDETSSHD